MQITFYQRKNYSKLYIKITLSYLSKDKIV